MERDVVLCVYNHKSWLKLGGKEALESVSTWNRLFSLSCEGWVGIKCSEVGRRGVGLVSQSGGWQVLKQEERWGPREWWRPAGRSPDSRCGCDQQGFRGYRFWSLSWDQGCWRDVKSYLGGKGTDLAMVRYGPDQISGWREHTEINASYVLRMERATRLVRP